MIGRTISHYNILEKLGEGGMGIVYKAHDTSLNRTVALKFLSPQAIDRDADKLRFIQEAQAAGGLHHPNICTIHEISERGGQMFIAMAYVEGKSLRECVAEGPLPAADAIDIIIQVCAGLHEAHEKGIVHRDIKPANIMLEESRRAIIMDFGLARSKDATRLTRTGATVGTIGYMSPEQLSGEEPDRCNDVWAVGVLLYELLTGHLPFRGDVAAALIYSITSEEPRRLSEYRDDLPAGLEGIVARALEKDTAVRYADTAALRADLEELRADPEAFPAGVPRRRKRDRKKATAIVAAAVIGLMIGASFVIPRLITKSQAVEALAVMPVTNLSGDEEQDVYAEGMHVELITTMGKINNLKVVGRRSVLPYRDTDKTPRKIAEELGVDALLEASVQFVGNRIHMSAEVVKASTGRILWADTFDASLSEALSLQKTIALAVADGINGRVQPGLVQEQAREVHPDAYREYLKYQADWSSSRAIPTLKRAVEIDSTFAQAWAALSQRAAYSAQYGHLPKDEGYALARKAAETAVALEPALPETHMSLSRMYWQQDWDFERSIAELEKATALKPAGKGVRSAQAYLMFLRGRVDEGIAIFEEIIADAPLDADMRMSLGWNLCNIRRYDLAIEHLQKNLEVFPNHHFSNMLLANAYAATGEYEKAVAQWKKMESMFEFLRVDADGDGIPEKGMGPVYKRGGGTRYLAVAYANSSARDELVAIADAAKAQYEDLPSGHGAWLVAFYLIPLGETEEAREWLEVSALAARDSMRAGAPRTDEDAFNQAMAYAALGEKDLAFEWLDVAFELRSPLLEDLYRKFMELWDDPRYAELMRRRGFPEDIIKNILL